MENKLNVAFIGNQIAFGGGATSFYLLIKSLKDKPINKFVFTSQIKSVEMKANFEKYCEVVDKIEIHEVKSSQTSRTSLISYYKAKRKIKDDASKIIKIINKYNIDIVHFNNSVFSHLYKEIKQKSNVKIITHVREMILSNNGVIPKIIIDNISKYSWKIFTISDNEKNAFSNLDNVYSLANPFDFSITNKKVLNLRNDWGVKKNTLIVGMIGRFAKSKGHMLFLEVANKIIKMNLNVPVKFAIVGISDRKPLWKRAIKMLLFRQDFGDVVNSYIKKNDLQKHLILIPYTKDIFNVINTFNIVVRPSLYLDPWGRDIIESMAMGKPIIANGTSEFFIKNNISGYLINGSIDEMVKSTTNLLENSSLAITMGKKGKEIIKAKCNIINYGNIIFSVYNNLK